MHDAVSSRQTCSELVQNVQHGSASARQLSAVRFGSFQSDSVLDRAVQNGSDSIQAVQGDSTVERDAPDATKLGQSCSPFGYCGTSAHAMAPMRDSGLAQNDSDLVQMVQNGSDPIQAARSDSAAGRVALDRAGSGQSHPIGYCGTAAHAMVPARDSDSVQNDSDSIQKIQNDSASIQGTQHGPVPKRVPSDVTMAESATLSSPQQRCPYNLCSVAHAARLA